MDLDDEDYELLGYVKADVAKPQKYNTKLNTLGLILTSNSWVRHTLGKEKKVSWRLRFPEKYKEINKKYRKSAKGKATAKAYRKAHPRPKDKSAKRNREWYKRIKKDPVKYAAYLAKQAKNIKIRRERKRGTKTTTTNKKHITLVK